MLTTTVLPIIMSLCLLLSGGTLWSADTSADYAGHYEIDIGGEKTTVDAALSQSGLAVSLEGALKAAMALDASGVTLTLNGQEYALAFDGSQPESSAADAVGLTPAQTEYFTGAKFLSDIGALGGVLGGVDLTGLARITEGADGFELLIEGGDVKKELTKLLLKLVSDPGAMDALCSLNAWDAFAPEAGDRQYLITTLLGGAVRAIASIREDFTLRVRSRGQGAAITLTLFDGYSETDIDVKISLSDGMLSGDVLVTVSGRSGYTLTPLAAYFTLLSDYNGLSGGNARALIMDGSSQTNVGLTIERGDDEWEASLLAQSASGGSLTGRVNGLLRLPRMDGRKATLELSLENRFAPDGTAYGSLSIDGEATDSGASLIIKDGGDSSIMTVGLDWSELGRFSGSLVQIYRGDVSALSLSAGRAASGAGAKFDASVNASYNGAEEFSAALCSESAQGEGGISQTLTLSVSGEGIYPSPLDLSAVATHRLTPRGAGD